MKFDTTTWTKHIRTHFEQRLGVERKITTGLVVRQNIREVPTCSNIIGEFPWARKLEAISSLH
jgi:hypothetical protein